MFNRNTIKVGTRVTFYPIDGALSTATGTIIAGKVTADGRMFTVRQVVGGYRKDWACRPSDIISAEPTPGVWGAND